MSVKNLSKNTLNAFTLRIMTRYEQRHPLESSEAVLKGVERVKKAVVPGDDCKDDVDCGSLVILPEEVTYNLINGALPQ